MQEKILVVKSPHEIRVVGDDDSYPFCSRRCDWFTLGFCNLFECDLVRDDEDQWPRCRSCMRAPVDVDADASGPESGEADLREKYPAFGSPTRTFHGEARYVPLTAAVDAAIHDKHVRGKGIRFWIYALVSAPLPDGEKQPTSLPCKATRVKKNAPGTVAGEMNTDEKVAFSEAMDADAPVWFIKIEDKGWDWGENKGTKDVEAVQDCLAWINKFRNKKSVNGAKLLYCDVSNQNV